MKRHTQIRDAQKGVGHVMTAEDKPRGVCWHRPVPAFEKLRQFKVDLAYILISNLRQIAWIYQKLVKTAGASLESSRELWTS